MIKIPDIRMIKIPNIKTTNIPDISESARSGIKKVSIRMKVFNNKFTLKYIYITIYFWTLSLNISNELHRVLYISKYQIFLI